MIKGAALLLVTPKNILASSLEKVKNPFSQKTFMALVETIVPGELTDPTKAPGAIEADTINYLWKVQKTKLLPVPIGLFRGVISSALNVSSFVQYRKGFYHLDRLEREKIVAKVESIPGVPLFYKVIRAPFYTGAMNDVGYKYFGYPGANKGYSDFSFKEKLAESHPRSVNGNLP